MNLKELLYNETTKTRTENGALAYSTTKSAILDLFGIGGAGRNLDEPVIYQKISQAFGEDAELGIRCLLFLGDIREGQGERRLFKIGLKVIADTQPKEIVHRVFDNVANFTRWDYLWDFIYYHKYSTYVLDLIKKEVETGKLSLIYKWLPSLQRQTKLALIIAEHLGLSKKEYRQMLSRKRQELKVVERTMSDNEWAKINYEHVPSKASLIYKDAFNRHDEERYQEYLSSVERGEKKINASTLYPHELVYRTFRENDKTVEALWKSLPDFVKDKDKNILPMVDVSGSMGCVISPQSNVEAIHVSVGLGLYLAERLKGEFKDCVLTFSGSPQLVKITGTSLFQKIQNISRVNWDMNTNIIKAFVLILDLAVKHNLPKEELPSTIVVFSDMEFDSASRNDQTPFDNIKEQYNMNGYELPQVVFWNLNARNVQFPVRQDQRGVILVSGYSPTTLQYVLTGEMKTPYELMVEVLSKERYNIFV